KCRTGLVKFLWRESRRRVIEPGEAELVGRSAQLAPGREISRAKDGVNARRSVNGKLKRSVHRLAWRDQLDRQRVSEHGDAIILPQRGDRPGQIRGRQRFGQHESRERIAVNEERTQLRQTRRQSEIGKLIVAKIQSAQ